MAVRTKSSKPEQKFNLLAPPAEWCIRKVPLFSWVGTADKMVETYIVLGSLK
jgi:hypothetical protein